MLDLGSPRAVLFDLDGTLLDTIDDLADSMNAALSSRGMPTHSADDYRGFIGDGIEMLARRALPLDNRDDPTVDGVVDDMRREYASRWDAKTRPYPGIPELLDELVRRGLKLAILSNKPHDFTQRIAARLLSRWPFDPVLGAQPGLPKKPDPSQAIHVATEHGISPERWLYLGDSGVDMKTAVAAGMIPLGVLWGFRGAEELRSHGARKLIEHPEQLLALLPAIDS